MEIYRVGICRVEWDITVVFSFKIFELREKVVWQLLFLGFSEGQVFERGFNELSENTKFCLLKNWDLKDFVEGFGREGGNEQLSWER